MIQLNSTGQLTSWVELDWALWTRPKSVHHILYRHKTATALHSLPLEVATTTNKSTVELTKLNSSCRHAMAPATRISLLTDDEILTRQQRCYLGNISSSSTSQTAVRWCSVSEKVTVGLALHWPCITDQGLRNGGTGVLTPPPQWMHDSHPQLTIL